MKYAVKKTHELLRCSDGDCKQEILEESDYVEAVNGNGAAFTYCLPCGLRHMGIHVNSVNRVVNQVMCALNRRTEPAVALHPAGADGEDEIEQARRKVG